jgi:hypothetical protein
LRPSQALLLVAAAVPIVATAVARADEPPIVSPDVVSSAATSDLAPSSSALLPTPLEEAPPPPPRKKGFVLESSLGAIGFMGQFRHVSPTTFWVHTQLGFEPLSWLMIFADGELFYPDTSEAQQPPATKAFPVFGFGGGVRFTIHPTDRFAIFAQGSVGALKADVPKGELVVLGYRDAEAINPSFGGRLGLEWYQVDRHMALGVAGGVRDATGFLKLTAINDTPLMWDASASLRYTF